ncbi:gamma-glutamylcyclotransferase [Vibrio sp. SM6]|uniref:Gamma-glutamylcyclotransferase n=1 Tax=Vibrio agarilyticus TaxID=2726741 RepID=A0A7X8TR43_9VIBR|nr:gamma-glutamylcyclotransferase family protein [Vibrio agarilyticus]NLS13096.1 gamma-glutamylcyclotransferase [Vibrio agarilyticus]
MHYIFGYGSLINAASRARTGETGRAIPAIASGLLRYWGQVESAYHHSPLIAARGEGKINGVLLEISSSALAQFDARERGYHRVELLNHQICSQMPFDRTASIWVYLKAQHLPPSQATPVLQSYVDTVLAGCLDVSPSFAQCFIESTLGWQFPRENDRQTPRYGNRAGIREEHYPQIDTLLNHPSLLSRHS